MMNLLSSTLADSLNKIRRTLRMASITISDVNPAGSEFFQGSESFLTDLTDDQQLYIAGGFISINGISVVRVPISEDIYSVSLCFVF
jgi:hypothetical protein